MRRPSPAWTTYIRRGFPGSPGFGIDFGFYSMIEPGTSRGQDWEFIHLIELYDRFVCYRVVKL